MANVKISALPAVTTVVPGTDVLPLVSNSGATTTKATPSAIVNAALLAPGPIGSGTASTGAFTTLTTTGSFGVGATAAAGQSVLLGKTITGAVSCYGILSNGTVQSDVTNTSQYFRTTASTANSNFSISDIRHFNAAQGAFSNVSAGGSVTNQYGFLSDATLTGATNNYGFYSNIASGTNRFNFYSAGTAANAFTGDLTIYRATAVPAGGTAGVGYKFSSTSNLGVFFGSGAPTLAAAQGSLYVRTDGSSTSTRLYVNTNGSTTWTNVTTAA